MEESVLSSEIIAAIIAGIVSLLAFTINSIYSNWRDRISRQRQEFSKAFAACVSYEEFPYIVRRRRGDCPEEERIRISSELCGIQKELAYYSAWLAIESKSISEVYENLVSKLKEIAGAKIHEAWEIPPITSDSDMNIPNLGLNELNPYKQNYLIKVKKHLSLVHKITHFFRD